MSASMQSLCQTHALLGRCLEHGCNRRHIALKPVVRKKLVLRPGGGFVPPEPIAASRPRCDCCRDRPGSCRGSPVCEAMGECYCLVREGMDAMGAAACECCGGDFLNCAAPLCRALEICQCQMHRDLEVEPSAPEFFALPRADCKCCRGFIAECRCVRDGAPNCTCMK